MTKSCYRLLGLSCYTQDFLVRKTAVLAMAKSIRHGNKMQIKKKHFCPTFLLCALKIFKFFPLSLNT